MVHKPKKVKKNEKKSETGFQALMTLPPRAQPSTWPLNVDVFLARVRESWPQDFEGITERTEYNVHGWGSLVGISILYPGHMYLIGRPFSKEVNATE